jgi:cytosine/creatinine deaminase
VSDTTGATDTAGAVYATDADKLAIARQEAEQGLADGGIPIGAALFAADGTLLGRGHNRRVQDDDASMHAETNAFRNAGRQPGYSGTTMVTTLSPCWYCSGLVKQFGISRVLVGEDVTFSGGHDWLREQGVEVEIVRDPALIAMMETFIAERPALWNEDIGVEDD